MIGEWILAVGEWALENTVAIMMVGFLILAVGLICQAAIDKSLENDIEELENLVEKMKGECEELKMKPGGVDGQKEVNKEV